MEFDSQLFPKTFDTGAEAAALDEARDIAKNYPQPAISGKPPVIYEPSRCGLRRRTSGMTPENLTKDTMRAPHIASFYQAFALIHNEKHRDNRENQFELPNDGLTSRRRNVLDKRAVSDELQRILPSWVFGKMTLNCAMNQCDGMQRHLEAIKEIPRLSRYRKHSDRAWMIVRLVTQVMEAKSRTYRKEQNRLRRETEVGRPDEVQTSENPNRNAEVSLLGEIRSPGLSSFDEVMKRGKMLGLDGMDEDASPSAESKPSHLQPDVNEMNARKASAKRATDFASGTRESETRLQFENGDHDDSSSIGDGQVGSSSSAQEPSKQSAGNIPTSLFAAGINDHAASRMGCAFRENLHPHAVEFLPEKYVTATRINLESGSGGRETENGSQQNRVDMDFRTVNARQDTTRKALRDANGIRRHVSIVAEKPVSRSRLNVVGGNRGLKNNAASSGTMLVRRTATGGSSSIAQNRIRLGKRTGKGAPAAPEDDDVVKKSPTFPVAVIRKRTRLGTRIR